ncbi:hypothetical protein Pse7367_1676 [Thalassoporum mexicanum PCC 7367]|uniref:hypothetical protein n=1 Tax=Thalassoporum mexicanum TaxID=3457544 RepID=UPI00029F9C6F|nr:hypothetical protein [Pseudanabaena sp. PCC 7367]AFY69964.1 hypothetical protein Pse7367_1676 [Pseudanabaena sp. PCC 7367]
MESWEFLLQKRGDKSWLPLEVPTVEILEGQYRLAAKSSFLESPIGIQIRYSPSDEVGYQPLQQKLSKRTNAEGLLIVTPYNHLTPGTWQIFCFALETATAGQKPWSTSIRFDVLPISPELAIELQLNHPDWETSHPVGESEQLGGIDVMGDLEPQPAVSTPGDRLRKFRGEESISGSSSAANAGDQPEVSIALDQDLGFDLDRNDRDMQDASQNLAASPNQAIDASTDAATDAVAELTNQEELDNQTDDLADDLAIENETALPSQLLSLDQSQFLISAGQTLQITGLAYVPGTIDINLKDPSDLSDLANASIDINIDINYELDNDPATQSEPPFPFSCAVEIPDLEQSQVMIGEVRLHPGDLDLELASEVEQKYLTHQPITVTYQSANLLAEAAQAAAAIADFAEATQTEADLAANAASSDVPTPIEAATATLKEEPLATQPLNLPLSPSVTDVTSSSSSASNAQNQAHQDLAPTAEQLAAEVKDQTAASQSPESPQLSQLSDRKPLAIPELPQIARQNQAAKQRQAAANANQSSTTGSNQIDLPHLPPPPNQDQPETEESSQPLPQEQQPQQTQQFEDIWGVQTSPPESQIQPPQQSQPIQPQPASSLAQPALPKLSKPGNQPIAPAPTDPLTAAQSGLEDSGIENLDEYSQAQAKDDTETSELSYGFEEDEPQYSFEDPHDFDDPAIAISSDALEFWEDAMRSPDPLSLADTPEELLAIPEIRGISDFRDDEGLDRADLESADPELDISFDLNRVPNLDEQSKQPEEHDRGDLSDLTDSIDSITDVVVDRAAELEQDAAEPASSSPSPDQVETESDSEQANKQGLGDRFLSKLQIFSQGDQEQETQDDDRSKQLEQSGQLTQPPKEDSEASQSGKIITPPPADFAISDRDVGDRNDDVSAPVIESAQMAHEDTTSAIDDLFPGEDFDRAQIPSEPASSIEAADPKLEELSNELEQMLIDTDRQATNLDQSSQSGENEQAAPESNQAPQRVASTSGNQPLSAQQLSRSQEFDEIVVDDPTLMPQSQQLGMNHNSDRQETTRPGQAIPTGNQTMNPSHQQQSPRITSRGTQSNPPQQSSPPTNQGAAVGNLNNLNNPNNPANQVNRNYGNQNANAANVPKLAEHELVPRPSLEVDEQNLTAGVPVLVRVKLAAIAPRLAVKIWVKDCQTRSLVDGPRWLFDFATIEDGSQVTSQTHITLPLGSMEVAFEAIAVEMLTQRESHKARLTRSVTPPNMGNQAPIDFDLP